MKDQFSGYILAGGKSSRMGVDKAFLEIGDQTFLENAVEILSSVCGNQVKILLNKSQKHFVEKLPDGVPHIFDAYENRGVPGGIHAALRNCETKYAIILAVDLPFVTVEAIEKLAETALSSNKFIAVVPRQTDGRLQPLCAVYHARYCLPALEYLMNENDFASANDFLELVAPRVIAQNKLTSGEAADLFFNINRPEDFRQIG